MVLLYINSILLSSIFLVPNCSIRSDPPRHGSAVCNIKKDGIYEAFICTVSCKKGYWFLQGENFPKLYNFYVCLNERTWRGRNVFNPKIKPPVTLFELIPKNNPMWPDCAGEHNHYCNIM